MIPVPVSFAVVIFFATQLALRSYCFNLDAAFPLRITPPSGSPALSSFGFSLAFYTRGRGQSTIQDDLLMKRGLLIGAPTSNDTSNPTTYRPGVVYFCPIKSFEHADPCQRLMVDNDITPLKSSQGSHSYRDNSLLGFSVAAQSAFPYEALVCAPLWTNGTMTSRTGQPFYAPTGACYRILQDGNSPTMPSRPWPKLRFPTGNLTRVNQASNFTVHLYSFSYTGFSAEYARDSTATVLLGAPGYSDGIGTVAHVALRPTTARNPPAALVNSASVNDQVNKEVRGYLGYTVASGQLMGNVTTYYAAGMPQAQSAGIVAVYRILPKFTRTLNVNNMDIKFFLKGSQLFEGFGQSILVVDLNHDRREDIIVGAPNAYGAGGDVDQGVVYVFYSIDAWKTAKPKEYFTSSMILTGSDGRGARFGSSLAALGDINSDGFNDFAVGSPFGKDGGSVYVYFGNTDEVKSKFTQRIRSPSNGRGFSWSLTAANGRQNALGLLGGYLAVGDFMNETVQVYRSHWVARWNIALNVNETKLSLNAPGHRYLLATICVQVTWPGSNSLKTGKNYIVKGRLVLDRNLPDSLFIQPRATFKSTNTGIRNVSMPFVYRTGASSTSECLQSAEITVQEPSSWPYEVGRVPLSVDFYLDEFVADGDSGKFCEACFSVSPDSATNASNTVTFSWCDEPSGNCRPIMDVSAVDTSLNVTLRANDTYIIHYDIYNEERSYIVRSPMLEFTLPLGMGFDRVEITSPGYSEMKMDCKDKFAESPENPTATNIVLCRSVNTGSVMYPGQHVYVAATFSTAKLNLAPESTPSGSPVITASYGHRYLQNGTEEIIWEPAASTSLLVTVALRLSANNAKTTLEIKPDAHDNVISRPSELKYNLSYEVINMGPGILPDNVAFVTILIPVSYQNISISRMTFLQIDNESAHISCLSEKNKIDTTQIITSKTVSDLTISFVETDLNEKPIKKGAFKMNCTDELTGCKEYRCFLPAMRRNEKVNITAGLEIVKESLLVQENRQTLLEIAVVSSAKLNLVTDSGIVRFDLSDEKFRSAQISTSIKILFTFSGLPWYIILAAGVGSFVVLVLIAVILVRSGFFRRKPLVIECEPIYEEHEVMFDTDDNMDIDKSTSSLVPVSPDNNPAKFVDGAGNRPSLL